MPAPIDTIREGLQGRSRAPGQKLTDEQMISEIDRWTRRDQNRWDLRNTRFQQDQDLYMMVKPGEWNEWTRRESDVIILPDARTLTKKVARIMARHPNNIEITPSHPDLINTAQRMENFLYGWDQHVNQHWMMGLNNPYRYDQAFYITLRGWLAERTMLRPDADRADTHDASSFYNHQVFDPANVFPFAAGGEIRRVMHTYRTTIEELLDDPMAWEPMANSYLRDSEGTAMIEVRGAYWKAADGGWYHAVLAGSEWLKKPTELGYNPWTITLANGAPYRATPWDDIGYQDQIGVGILDDSAENQKNLNRMASKLQALLSLEANPPVTIYGDGRPKKVDFFPGARMFLTQKDKLEAHRIGPQAGDYKLLWDILQDRASKAGFPDVFWGQNVTEGLATTIALSSGKDVLWPFVEALNQADAMKYRKVFELYRDHGPSAPLQARVLSPLGIGQLAEITASDIISQGVLVEVTREDMTPQELMQKLNLGLALVKGQALPMREFRGKGWMNLRNPDAANLQVLSEQVYMNPAVINALVPIALSDTGQQMLGAMWSMVQSGMPAPGSPATPNGAPAGMEGAPGGQGPTPASPSAGQPTQVLTPGAAGNPAATVNMAPQDQNLQALIASLTGGAVGGAGGGGMPPNQALLSQLTRPQGAGMF